ncbi:aminotransferase [Agrobacterium rhizogenes]|uniref:aminotransferase n=1 Tax=Rhizobium rhizogenes TaxID=359 RepID=UPI0004DA0D52|nr:aminotransferase [Rhizobium rhizogenes]OCI95969.1 aminotransferase [Agrobacterium sp. 13-626]OCJ23211.1 aminotransferase [Agrobacterium sp. B133/95]KEA08410.1 aminotransferase [Rhizobium rhizogenes]MQB31311.1 aminotransferase [Rhizobium rhizogenes]NTF51123.1 aminotransferase [Rhizobium rhizogenes]
MKIRDFGVEIWMNRYETICEWNLAETCVESLTVAELLAMAGKTETILSELLLLKLTYGAIEGSDRLRRLIAGLYEKQAIENVVVTHGAIGANALVHETLVEPGDRVISILPTYQQHYSIPESYGADLQILKLTEANGFLPDLQELWRLATPDTKLIVLNNPNNPTGALMDRAYLEKIVEIARISGAWILCDEVYRGTDQQGDGMTASIADLYEKGISTGSMSKTYSLAGLRLGWIVARSELIHAVSIHRDYNTISVGMLDDHFAAIALENRDKILARSQAITRTNLAILSEWVESEPLISWVRPKSGTTALLKYHLPLSSEAFCIKLLEQTGVMLTPGSAMDMEGYLRIGYANSEAILREGLKRLSQFLKEQQQAVACA